LQSVTIDQVDPGVVLRASWDYHLRVDPENRCLSPSREPNQPF
jgi:hypothetical protein